MSGSVNRVILVGNLGRDPEIRSAGGGRIANFSLATSERWKDKATGEQQDKTEWHRVVVFNDRLVDVIERFVAKGSKLYVEGQLQTRKWTDKSGVEKYSTEVVLSRFRGELVLLGSRDGDASERPARQLNADLDDEIPFAWLGALIAPGLALLALGGLA